MHAERRPRVRLATTIVLGAVLALSAATAGAGGAPPARAATPTVTATPASNVVDGQFVSLALSGFAASQVLSFRQCIPNPVNVLTDCTAISRFAGNGGSLFLDATGAGLTQVPVFTTADQSNPSPLENSGSTGTLTCDENHACVIAAMLSSTTLTTATFVSLAFAPSPNLCPLVPSHVVGEGSAAANRVMTVWESSVCGPPQNVPIVYAPTNSPDGVNYFTNGVTKYAITGPWAPSEAPVSTATPPLTWGYAPLALSAVVLAFLIFEPGTGVEVSHLTLTPDMLAQLFSNGTASWNGVPAVTTLNPGVTFPNLVSAYLRAEHNSETWEFSSWLSKVAPTTWVWPSGAQQGQPLGAFDTWPQSLNAAAYQGGDAASAAIRGQAPSVCYGPSGCGWVVLTDINTANYFGLGLVQVKRADGSVTTADSATITQAISDATSNTDGTLTPAYNTTDPGAWPMPMPLYMMAPTNQVDFTTGAELAGFIHYAAGQGQSVLPPGYAPLTPALATQANTVAASIPTGAVLGSQTTPNPTPAPLAPLGTPAPLTSLGGAHLGVASPASTSTPAPAAAAAKPKPKPTATLATAQLPLNRSGFAIVAPAVAGVALASLLVGVGLEIANRVRRRAAVRAATRGRG